MNFNLPEPNLNTDASIIEKRKETQRTHEEPQEMYLSLTRSTKLSYKLHKAYSYNLHSKTKATKRANKTTKPELPI